MPDVLDRIRTALADPNAPWYGSDLVDDVGEALEENKRLRDTLLSRHGGEPLALLEELDAARERIEELESLVYIPGDWKCDACGLLLTAQSFDPQSGEVGVPRVQEVESCPNGCGSMRRWTYKESDAEAEERLERQAARIHELEAALVTDCSEVFDTWERPPCGDCPGCRARRLLEDIKP